MTVLSCAIADLHRFAVEMPRLATTMVVRALTGDPVLAMYVIWKNRHFGAVISAIVSRHKVKLITIIVTNHLNHNN